jgi:hypothetical protein
VRRPILEWLEDEENDLWEVKVKRWRQKANNGKEFAKEIKVLSGLHSQELSK